MKAPVRTTGRGQGVRLHVESAPDAAAQQQALRKALDLARAAKAREQETKQIAPAAERAA